MTHELEAEGLHSKSRDPLTDTERREFHLRLHRAMAHLSEREHEAISLRVLEGRTHGEVAEIMGVKEATVRSHIRHAGNRLRKIMEDSGYELPRFRSSY